MKIADASPILKRIIASIGKTIDLLVSFQTYQIYEKIIYKQTDNLMSPKFSPYIFTFQYSLLKMIEIWKHLEKSYLVGVLWICQNDSILSIFYGVP